MFAFGDFHVLYPHPENEHMGILLELKGRGCRQLESIMQEQGRAWRDFFRDYGMYAVHSLSTYTLFVSKYRMGNQ